MKINSEFAAFVSSNVMIVLGSRDHLLMPDIARAVGAVVHAEEGCIDLLISEWQWPNTVANVRANGQMSVTFARPSDYVSYQAKGFAEVIRAKAEYIFAAQRYTASMTSTLVELGLDPRTVAPWFSERELTVLSLRVHEIFVQTPGVRAGQLIERRT